MMRLTVLLLQQGMTRPRFELTPRMLQQFRRDGYLCVPPSQSLLEPMVLKQLRAACESVATSRGPNVVPSQDEQLKSNVSMKSTFRPAGGDAPFNPPCTTTASADAMKGPPVDEEKLKAQLSQQQAPGVTVASDATLEKRTVKMHVRLRTKKDVDRAYERIKMQRQAYLKEKNLVDKVQPLMEAHEKDPSRVRPPTSEQITSQYDAQDAVKAFEGYRDSGKLERDVRKGQHIDEAFEFINNAVQTWIRAWLDDGELTRLVVNSSNKPQELLAPRVGPSGTSSFVGKPIGEVAASLCGSLVVRLYDDTIVRFPPLCNALPVYFPAAFSNFRDPRGVDAMIALPPSSSPPGSDPKDGVVQMVMFPGSHHVIRDITNGGKDLAQFQRTSLWDIGESFRAIPQLKCIAPVVVPMVPGSVLFTSHLMLRSAVPPMRGIINRHGTMEQLKSSHSTYVGEVPMMYLMSMMPDGAVFDGARVTWMARDSHGPLYEYTAGQALRDDVQFPVLYNDVDVE